MEWPKCTRCLSKDIDCVYPSSRAAPAAPGGPALDPLLSQQSLSWLDGLTQEPGMVPWSGELQTQMATILPAPQFIDTSVEEVVRTTLPPLDTDAAVHIFKSWPDKWLREGKAPFIHPQLYNSTLPQPLQEAYAACAIYATTTLTNRYIAFNIIESKSACPRWAPIPEPPSAARPARFRASSPHLPTHPVLRRGYPSPCFRQDRYQ